MVTALNEASSRSADPPETGLSITHRRSEGRVGRPKIHINPTFLSSALQLRGPARLSTIVDCHPRTVRRRALELGLVTPGEPVYRDTTADDGSITRTWTSTTSPVSVISDEELDLEINDVLEIFPMFGRAMIAGYLRVKGLRIPITRITQSYHRVHGVPAVFGPRQIQRRVYWVPGPNSLWHHDGQHGMWGLYTGNF
jgi:hypothetical protein